MNLYPVKLHPGQLALFHDKRPVVIGMFGRRGGKSYYGINTLPMKALSFQGQTSLVSPEKVLAAMPTFKQAKEIIWKPLVDICTYTSLAKYVKNINRTDYEIEFYGRKPKIVVRGVAEGLRGGRLYYFWGDEWQDAGNTAFDEIVSPALADTPNSSALITGTPKGKLNILYKLSERAKEHSNVYGFHNYPTWVNPNRSLLKEIWIAKKVLPPKVWEQEYKASFVNFDGQIYSELTEDNRPLTVNGLTDIGSIVRELDYTVLGVDWGQTNPAIVVLGYKLDVRREVSQVYVLEGWQGDGSQPIPMPVFEANILRLATKWSAIATFCDPSQPSSILAIRSLGKEHNQQGLVKAVAGYNRIDEGILQVHSLIYQKKLLFPKLTFGGSKGYCTSNDIYDKAIAYHYKSRDGLVSQQVEDGQDDHCLTGDTLVTTDRGLVRIEDVNLSDKVLTRKGFRSLKFSGQTGINQTVYEVKLSNGSSFKATAKHPILVDDHWVTVDALRYSDRVTTVSESLCLLPCAVPVYVVNVTKLKNKADVYNLEVNGDHEFYANGILVHNCLDAIRYAIARKRNNL